MFEINSKKFLALLEKYKRSDDKDSFKDEYEKMFPLNVKYTNPTNLELCFSEEISGAIDRNIILDLIWISKTDVLKHGLRDEKLKRILENYED